MELRKEFVLLGTEDDMIKQAYTIFGNPMVTMDDHCVALSSKPKDRGTRLSSKPLSGDNAWMDGTESMHRVGGFGNSGGRR